MGSFSDSLEASLLNYVLGNVSYVPPSTTYIGLFTTNPSDSGGGVEVTGGNYSRVGLTNNTTSWPNATGTSPTTKTLGVSATFPTASANWGTITGFAIFDSGSGGVMLLWSALTTPRAVNSGDTARFNTGGSMTITLD